MCVCYFLERRNVSLGVFVGGWDPGRVNCFQCTDMVKHQLLRFLVGKANPGIVLCQNLGLGLEGYSSWMIWVTVPLQSLTNPLFQLVLLQPVGDRVVVGRPEPASGRSLSGVPHLFLECRFGLLGRDTGTAELYSSNAVMFRDSAQVLRQFPQGCGFLFRLTGKRPFESVCGSINPIHTLV